MEFEFLLNEPNSPSLRLKRSIWTGRTKLYADEQEVPMQPSKGYFHSLRSFALNMPDGSHRQLTLKNRYYDLVPEAHVDGQPLLLAKALQTWEYVVACIPILLMFGAGVIGGAFGVGAIFLNLGIMRSERSMGVRIALCVGITLGAFVGVVVLASMLQLAIEK